MFTAQAAFSGFSVDNLAKARAFYIDILGLKLEDDTMGLTFRLPGAGKLFIYPKPDHQPATFTVLNFVVGNIDEAVDALNNLGVQLEHYDGEMKTDEKGIARGKRLHMGPDIGWFKDPAGNILSILEDDTEQ